MVRHIILFVLAVALIVAGPYAYRRWQHRYICIPPMPPHGSDRWMEDRMCGPADMLKEMVDVGQFTEPVTPITGFDGVPAKRKDSK